MSNLQNIHSAKCLSDKIIDNELYFQLNKLIG